MRDLAADTMPMVASQRGRGRWLQAIAFYLVMQALSAGLNALASYVRRRNTPGWRRASRGDTRWSDTLKRPVFQPPNWLFPIAWPINNFGEIYGGLRVLDKPAGTPGRTLYLVLQAATWVDYVLFSAGYFGLRSTINSFVLTACYLALTMASLVTAIVRLRDWRVALSLATTLLWLCVALPSALAQMLWNRDEFYHAGPFAKPNRALLKK
jgi:tryptophan-rich sensory protein